MAFVSTDRLIGNNFIAKVLDVNWFSEDEKAGKGQNKGNPLDFCTVAVLLNEPEQPSVEQTFIMPSWLIFHFGGLDAEMPGLFPAVVDLNYRLMRLGYCETLHGSDIAGVTRRLDNEYDWMKSLNITDEKPFLDK